MRVRSYSHIKQATLLARTFPLNCYLVEEPDGLTLVDTTVALGASRIVRIIHNLGKPLRRIAFTHVHADHIGGLDRLKVAFPNAEVLIPARGVPLLQGDLSLLESEDPNPVLGKFQPIQTIPDTLLTEGDKVGSLQVIASPGHSPDSISFFDHRTGSLICGDAFQTKGGIAVAGDSRFWFPWVAAATWSPAVAQASAAQLLALEPNYLMPGHGRVLVHPTQAMAGAIGR